MKKYIVLILSLVFVTIAKADKSGAWCGTAQALEDYREGKLPTRPTLSGPEIIIDRTLFRIHYTQQGNDAVSVAYAESAASYAAYCWAKEVDTLSWAAPPPDYGQGGDNRYDYYLTALPSGIAGVTYAENSYSNPYPDGVCSHIRIARDLDNTGLKTTISHEFCHACQFRYSSNEGTWWMENCAVWMEEMCYDYANDYLGFLGTSPNPFSNPELPINCGTNLYWYAGATWPIFLGECYGIDYIRQIWVYQGTVSGQNTISGIEHILSTQCSSSMITALKQYAIWRYFTGSRADTVHYYKEGHLMPTVRILRSHNSYPVSGDQGNYPISNPGGTNYVQFLNGGGTLFASFNAQSVCRWACFVVGYRPNNMSTVYEIPLNSSGAGSETIPWQDNEHFVLIPVAIQWEYSTGALPFYYSADISILHDVGLCWLTGFPTLVDSGAAVTPQAMVKNYGIYSENFPVQLTIGNIYSNVQNINLNAGDSVLVYFPACTLITRDYKPYKCKTTLASDERRTNDSLFGQLFVRVKDLATIAIIEPQGNITQGSQVHPKARIKNYGNVRENFDLAFSIGSWSAAQRYGLNAGLEYEFTLDSIWYANDTGNYVVKCSTRLSNDVNTNNDRLISSCYVLPNAIYEDKTVNINVVKLPSIILMRNRIDITGTSRTSNILLEIFDAQGKKVYTEQCHNLPISIKSSLSTGCYIIRLKLDNDVILSKSVIIKS